MKATHRITRRLFVNGGVLIQAGTEVILLEEKSAFTMVVRTVDGEKFTVFLTEIEEIK